MNPFDTTETFPKSLPDSSEVIYYTMLGLGDQIVCIGLANFLTKKYSKVYVPTKTQYFKMMQYCYKNNSKIEVFEVSGRNEKGGCSNYPGVNHLQEKTKLPTIHSGHSKGCHPKYPWPFYTNNDFDYSISFDHFYLPKEGKEDQEMFEHLMNIYNVSGDYILVGGECSERSYDLKIDSKLPQVHLKVSEDLHSNIFFYQKLIREAKEIHLIDSAYLHLAERIRNKKGMLYYHGHRGHRTTLYNPKESIRV